MNITRLRIMAGTCGLFLLAFSVSADAQKIDTLGSGISVEFWLPESGRDVPVLSFERILEQQEVAADIRAENIIQDKDGSTRFQLSYSGPLSRQVFANVHSVAQEDGFTRNIITNIADGGQSEYLSRTTDLTKLIEQDKISGGSLPVRLEESGDQKTECLSCIAIIVVGIACVMAKNRSYQQCRENCRSLGGIKYFDAGICGSVSSECTCWTQPREIAIEF